MPKHVPVSGRIADAAPTQQHLPTPAREFTSAPAIYEQLNPTAPHLHRSVQILVLGLDQAAHVTLPPGLRLPYVQRRPIQMNCLQSAPVVRYALVKKSEMVALVGHYQPSVSCWET